MDVNSFYESLKTRQTDAEQLGWIDEKTQQLNFKLICDMLDNRGALKGCSVHDLGCGYGDLVPHLRERGVASYVGSDVIPRMLTRAREKYPSETFVPLHGATNIYPVVDTTIICGALPFNTAENIDVILMNAWSSTRKSLAFLTWWDVPKSIQPAKEHKEIQRIINGFLRRSCARVDSRIGDYGVPYEAIFVVSR